jgi:hypothetical protein
MKTTTNNFMEKLKNIVLFYSLGMVLTFVIIAIIHLYSYLSEHYFIYAEWNNILLVALISGIPFGIAIWAFSKFFKKCNSQNSNS